MPDRLSTYSRFFAPSSESSGFGQRSRKKNKMDGYWTILNIRILLFLICVAGSLSNSLFKITGKIIIDV